MDKILENTLAQLAYHQPEQTKGMKTLNRLISKAMFGEFLESDFTSSQLEMSAAELRLIYETGNPYHHDRQAPHIAGIDNPVIVLECEGKRYLIDGGNRVNYWLARDPAKNLRVNLHQLNRKLRVGA